MFTTIDAMFIRVDTASMDELVRSVEILNAELVAEFQEGQGLRAYENMLYYKTEEVIEEIYRRQMINRIMEL